MAWFACVTAHGASVKPVYVPFGCVQDWKVDLLLELFHLSDCQVLPQHVLHVLLLTAPVDTETKAKKIKAILTDPSELVCMLPVEMARKNGRGCV